jgi:hypothetical protein
MRALPVKWRKIAFLPGSISPAHKIFAGTFNKFRVLYGISHQKSAVTVRNSLEKPMLTA